ncbi:MAG: nicotinate-nucleotide--dimethylbenzimidazole phosphoribosyltransferase [Pseudomonadota bacterium]
MIARTAAAARNDQLTKPPGALGRLESLALWMAEWQGRERPAIDHAQAIVFAGNHGVAAQGVSAFPPDVTIQMVANFEAGGAAINQLCASNGAALSVVPLLLDQPTEDFTQAPALGEDDLLQALATGWEAVDQTADCLLLGEMGIGNTTAAAALAAALFGGQAERWIGRGTGVDAAGLGRKCEVVAAGLARTGDVSGDPVRAVAEFAGREMAAMMGATLRARALRCPVLLDGFIGTAAVAPLSCIDRAALAHCQASHRSAEAAHGRLLDALGLDPVLSLDLRLGEGSGAALALGIVRAALACHNGMATFSEAAVSAQSG